MAVETNQPRLVNEYEAIRRREYTVFTDLLDVLPKINDLPQEYTNQARDALFHADNPFLMVFVGPFSSGKSSLINALLGNKNLLAVGPVPTTDRISILRWGEDPQRMDSGGDVDAVFHPTPLLKKVSFVDTPGLESVFQRHEEVTRNFLHRSDVVILVMLATQAMTSRNVEYMQKLREYGKKIIIVINQADVLSEDERETVRQYVVDQSLSKLGYQPQVWLVSAKLGLEARAGETRGETLDEELWKKSGLHEFEQYIDNQLGDVERLRQKLQTPLQIMQNVNANALRALRSNQSVLDQYQSINNNIDEQLAAHQREQEKNVREINQMISDKFGETSMRGSEAIREIFQLSRAFTSLVRGVGELTGIARLFRRGGQPSYVTAAFNKYKVFEPINELPFVVDKVGPRLEGRDLQDIDDLVKYGQREVKQLPATIQNKVIGTIQAPLQYDRRALQDVRPELERLEDDAKVIETDKIADSVKNSLLYLALFEVLMVVFGVAVLASGIGQDQPQFLVVLLMIVLGLALLGLAFLPLMGRVIENRYTNRLLQIQAKYIEALSKATDHQIEYGMRLRRDVVAPLTRLVEAQTSIYTEQLERLRFAEQEMAKIETDLNRLGSRNILGIGK